ncbi:MAG: 4-hydroxy-tetrahydrodipicolinate synthase [Clostridia bacterium]|nr:4-hydroxy-tetrahydrodipicolinate synthase [Clostridia bacterium]
MATLFEGCGTALLTPFKRNQVDYPALARLIDAQIAGGVDALIACGTTAEPATMTEEEWQSVLAFVIRQAAGRVPVIAGTGGNNTMDVIRKARVAKDLGASAQLCVTPYYNKTTQAGLAAHYRAIARESGLPVIVYNVPSRTGLNMLPQTLHELADEENIIAVKEASGSLTQIMEMIRLCGDRIALYSGSDELTAPIRAVGGKGVISVTANIAPQIMAEMAHAPIERAAELNLQYLPLINALFSEVNPIPVKAAAAMMGLCKNEVRLPLIPLSREHQKQLKYEMQKAGLL